MINSLRINLFYLECVKRPENLHPLRMAKTHLIPDTAATAAVTRRGVRVWAGAVPLPAAVANAVAGECINLEGKTTCAARELLKAKTGKENFGEQVAKLRLCARGCQCCQYAGLERANTHTHTQANTQPQHPCKPCCACNQPTIISIRRPRSLGRVSRAMQNSNKRIVNAEIESKSCFALPALANENTIHSIHTHTHTLAEELRKTSSKKDSACQKFCVKSSYFNTLAVGIFIFLEITTQLWRHP